MNFLNSYRPSVKDAIKKNENEIISNIQIVRTPLAKAMDIFINVTSNGKVDKVKKEGNFDEMFHLNINLTTTNNKSFVLEKNESINFEAGSSVQQNSEVLQVDIVPPNLSIGQLLSNTKKRQGNKYYLYSASSNNCQKFIKDVFESNGITDAKYITFIKQNTSQIFKNPNLRKFANTVTTGAAVAAKIGDYVNKYKNPKKWFGGSIPPKQDLKKLTVAELKAIIKVNKKVYNRKVTITGLKKADLIKLVEELY
jgi:hypothetical protein